MIGDLLDAVVRHVGNRHAQFRCRVHRDVVYPNPVASNHDAFLRRSQDGIGNLREARQNAVNVPREFGKGGLAAVRRHHELGPDLSQHRLFWLYGGPHVIRH